MAANFTSLAFVDGGGDVYVRIVTPAGAYFDYLTLSLELQDTGVIFDYNNVPGHVTRVFVPYTKVDSIFQG